MDFNVNQFLSVKNPCALIVSSDHGNFHNKQTQNLFEQKLSNFHNIIEQEKCDACIRFPYFFQNYLYQTFDIKSIHVLKEMTDCLLIIFERTEGTKKEKINANSETEENILSHLSFQQEKMQKQQDQIYMPLTSILSC